LVVGGIEIINAYSELNDPEEQRERFERSEEDISKGSAEAQFGDEDYVEALEYGMPPAAGFGIGIDRLIMLLTDSHNIREVILFPTMRPKKAGE
ncbi:MAG: Lysine-tRNA ligase, partial [Parcubacteria group bacterium GW2011_GWB1_40_14]